MEFITKTSTNVAIICATLVLLCCGSATNAQRRSPPAPPTPIGVPTPAPAPAPGPEHVNLTYLLSYAGPFHTFLKHLQNTRVLDTFQNQANNTVEGLTLFVPQDKAFTSLKKPSLANLTQEQLKSLCLFHALPHYYSLSDFGKLSQQNPIQTFAGGAYTLNFTDNAGTIHVNSGWTNTKVISAVHASDPVAVYEVNDILLPIAIFGTDIPPPPPPAPAPAPAVAPAAADAPVGRRGGATSSPAGGSTSASPVSSRWSLIVNLSCIVAWAMAILSHL